MFSVGEDYELEDLCRQFVLTFSPNPQTSLLFGQPISRIFFCSEKFVTPQLIKKTARIIDIKNMYVYKFLKH